MRRTTTHLGYRWCRIQGAKVRETRLPMVRIPRVRRAAKPLSVLVTCARQHSFQSIQSRRQRFCSPKHSEYRSIAFVEPYCSKRLCIISSCTTPPALEMPVTGTGRPMLDSNHSLRSYDAWSGNFECMISRRVICTPSNICAAKHEQ